MKPALLLLLILPAFAEPLTLREALETAAKASPDIQLARLRTLESEAQALARRAGLLPQLNAQVAANYQTSNLSGIGVSGASFPRRVGPYRVMDARPRLSQTVLDLSLLSSYRAARALSSQRAAESDVVAEQTRLAIVQLYLQALAADSRARSNQARVATAAALLRQVEETERAGTASKLDVARARQQLETEQTTLVLAARDRDTVLTLLKRTIGLEQTAAFTLAEITPPSADPSPATRPELHALDAEARVLDAELQAARRERLPKITALGDFGVQGSDPSYALSTYTVGLQATIPLWTSGRIENDIKAARQRIAQLDQRRRAQQLAISQEEARALVERDAAARALEAAARASAAAKETLELARLRFSAGLTTHLDVVTAQGNLAQSEEEEIRLRYDGLLAAAQLARARGDVLAFTR